MRRHVAACLVAVAASSARSAKQRGFEGYDKTDPFGEKMAWDNDIAYAKMKSVDVEALVSSFRSDDVQSTHFGPDWARLPTLARAAVSRVKTHPNDKAAPMQTTLDGDSVSATAPSMRYSAAMLAGMPQSYEEMVAAEDAAAEAKEDEVDVPASLGRDGPDRDAVAREVGALAAQSRSADAAPSPSPTASPMAYDATGISAKDPLEWTTAEVVAWLRLAANIDEDMVSAFEMVGVDGRMLLNDVMPCDMFKEMRKWHNRGRHERPNAAEMLVQETIMLCYPYGK
jgi:hypothetical protein